MSARFILLRALQSGGPIRCSVKHIRSSDLAKKDDEAYRDGAIPKKNKELMGLAFLLLQGAMNVSYIIWAAVLTQVQIKERFLKRLKLG